MPKFIGHDADDYFGQDDLPVLPEVTQDMDDKLEIKPIDDLDIEQFALQASKFIHEPKKYTNLITGIFKRWQLRRGIKAVDLFTEYLNKLRLASDSARDLQEAIIKNRIIFKFQVQFAIQRLQQEWLSEKKGFELDIAMKEADIERHHFLKRFYKKADPHDLSETGLLLLTMMTAKISSSTSSLMGSSVAKENYNPAEILQVKQQEKWLEVFMKEQLAEIETKQALARKVHAEADQTEEEGSHKKWKHKRERKRDEEI